MKNIDYQIFDAIDASIYWKDLDGKYLGCNAYMAKMAGLARSQIIGSTDYLLPWKEQANKIREIDLLVIAQRKKYEIEENPVISGGARKVYLSSKSPLLSNAGEMRGIIGVSIDITSNKKFKLEFEKTKNTLDKYLKIKNGFLENNNYAKSIKKGKSDFIDYLVGERLKLYRISIGMTQSELSQEIGVSTQQIQKYETGINRIASGKLYHISKFLKIPIIYFFD